MRDRSVRFALGLLSLSPALAMVSLGACGASPPITVVRRAAADKVEDIKGDHVKLKRTDQTPYEGARGGYYVVRNGDDWKLAWPGNKAPPMPESLDTSSFMVFLGVAEYPNVSELKFERSVETSGTIYVWAKETKLGAGCTNKPGEHPFDAVVTKRLDKPVRFIVEEAAGESCGQPPAAKVECRLKDQPTWSNKLEAQPGDPIECELTASSRGKFEIIDRVMSIDLPAGSSAKLAFAKGPTRGELGVDVYGTYTVRGEAADEGGRRGTAAATIDVKPPKTKDVFVQLVWTGFERSDDPDTFPRLNMRLAEEGPKGQRCSADIPVPGLCEVKTRGSYTYMRVPESRRKLDLSVLYLDERAEKGPAPCVHVWYDGQRATETCDRKHRAPEETWKVGTLDTSTGKLDVESELADGGAPQPTDAGATKKAAPSKPKPAPKP